MFIGIGNFIIVDDSKISCEDADNDFFVPFDQVGKNKAEVCFFINYK